MLHHAVVFCLEFRSAVQCHLPDCVVGVPVHARQVTMTEGCNSNKTSISPCSILYAAYSPSNWLLRCKDYRNLLLVVTTPLTVSGHSRVYYKCQLFCLSTWTMLQCENITSITVIDKSYNIGQFNGICNYVTCHISHVTCHITHVTLRMSHVICQMVMLILGTCWATFVFMCKLKSEYLLSLIHIWRCRRRLRCRSRWSPYH